MLSLRTQAAITVLHGLSSNDNLQSDVSILSSEEWRVVFQELERGKLIRLLPQHTAGTLYSYELCRPLTNISLLDVLQALNEPVSFIKPTPEEFYERHSQIARRVGVLNQVARTFFSEIKIVDW